MGYWQTHSEGVPFDEITVGRPLFVVVVDGDSDSVGRNRNESTEERSTRLEYLVGTKEVQNKKLQIRFCLFLLANEPYRSIAESYISSQNDVVLANTDHLRACLRDVQQCPSFLAAKSETYVLEQQNTHLFLHRAIQVI